MGAPPILKRDLSSEVRKSTPTKKPCLKIEATTRTTWKNQLELHPFVFSPFSSPPTTPPRTMYGYSSPRDRSNESSSTARPIFHSHNTPDSRTRSQAPTPSACLSGMREETWTCQHCQGRNFHPYNGVCWECHDQQHPPTAANLVNSSSWSSLEPNEFRHGRPEPKCILSSRSLSTTTIGSQPCMEPAHRANLYGYQPFPAPNQHDATEYIQQDRVIASSKRGTASHCPDRANPSMTSVTSSSFLGEQQRSMVAGVSFQEPYTKARTSNSASRPVHKKRGVGITKPRVPLKTTQDNQAKKRRLPPCSNEQNQEPTKADLAHAVAYLNTNNLSDTYMDGTPVPPQRQLLVHPDRSLLTDYSYYMMKQLRHCHFSERDRKTRGGKRQAVPIGFGGLQCVHCCARNQAAEPQPRKFFWAHSDRLANSFSEISSHILKCRACPKATKDALSILKAKHPEQMTLLPRGSLKIYFRRMWERIQDTPVERGPETTRCDPEPSLSDSSVPPNSSNMGPSLLEDTGDNRHVGSEEEEEDGKQPTNDMCTSWLSL